MSEDFRRFRSAMLLCYAIAAGLCAYVLTERRHEQELASLGVAFWIVGCLLLVATVWLGVRVTRDPA